MHCIQINYKFINNSVNLKLVLCIGPGLVMINNLAVAIIFGITLCFGRKHADFPVDQCNFLYTHQSLCSVHLQTRKVIFLFDEGFVLSDTSSQHPVYLWCYWLAVFLSNT